LKGWARQRRGREPERASKRVGGREAETERREKRSALVGPARSF
jgi:hypothetical protein